MNTFCVGDQVVYYNINFNDNLQWEIGEVVAGEIINDTQYFTVYFEKPNVFRDVPARNIRHVVEV